MILGFGGGGLDLNLKRVWERKGEDRKLEMASIISCCKRIQEVCVLEMSLGLLFLLCLCVFCF